MRGTKQPALTPEQRGQKLRQLRDEYTAVLGLYGPEAPQWAERLLRIPGVGRTTAWTAVVRLSTKPDRDDLLRGLAEWDSRHLCRLAAKDELPEEWLERLRRGWAAEQQARQRRAQAATELRLINTRIAQEEQLRQDILTESLGAQGVNLDGAPPVIYHYSSTQNLKCPSCRNHLNMGKWRIVATHEDRPVYVGRCPVHKDRLVQVLRGCAPGEFVRPYAQPRQAALAEEADGEQGTLGGPRLPKKPVKS